MVEALLALRQPRPLPHSSLQFPGVKDEAGFHFMQSKKAKWRKSDGGMDVYPFLAKILVMEGGVTRAIACSNLIHPTLTLQKDAWVDGWVDG